MAHHLRFPGKHAPFIITETIWIPDAQNPDLECPYHWKTGNYGPVQSFGFEPDFYQLFENWTILSGLFEYQTAFHQYKIVQICYLDGDGNWIPWYHISWLAKMDQFLGCLLLRLCLYSRYPKIGHVNSQNFQYLWSGIHKVLPLKYLSCFLVFVHVDFD